MKQKQQNKTTPITTNISRSLVDRLQDGRNEGVAIAGDKSFKLEACIDCTINNLSIK